MRSRFLAAVVACGLTGCAEEPPDLQEQAFDLPPQPILHATRDLEIHAADLAAREVVEDARCEPMSDEGPCALVCDREELIERYVPEGTCIHFACTARDGTQHNLGACR